MPKYEFLTDVQTLGIAVHSYASAHSSVLRPDSDAGLARVSKWLLSSNPYSSAFLGARWARDGGGLCLLL